MNNQSDNTGKLIGTFLLGAVVGGVLGVLFAPDKGSETRKKIAGKTDDFTKTLQEKFKAFSDEAIREYEAAKERSNLFAQNDDKE